MEPLYRSSSHGCSQEVVTQWLERQKESWRSLRRPQILGAQYSEEWREKECTTPRNEKERAKTCDEEVSAKARDEKVGAKARVSEKGSTTQGTASGRTEEARKEKDFNADA